MNRPEFTRRDFLRVAGVGAVAPFAGAAQTSRPNIVYVFSDQQRNCSWPGGGDPQVKTPNLEAFAREGVVFNHCISNYPLCSPHRASLLTGRYPQANTITSNVRPRMSGLPATEVTIADVLKKAGYVTGYVGKWHLHPGQVAGQIVPPGPHRHGFDYWRVCHNYRQRYDTRYFDDNGKEVVIREYGPKGQMDLTMDFIEKNAARPFCVFLSWHPPHAPYTEAPQRFADLYSPDRIKLRPNVPKEWDTKQWRRSHAGYFASVSALDDEVGRLTKKLAQLGIADNTIVCYSSDHGDMLASFGLTAKRKPWEESINVPFLIRWPAAIPKGKRLDTLFSTVDVTPTLLGLAGVPVPGRMQGADLSAIVRGKDAPGPESAFIMAIGGGQPDDEEGGAGSRKGKGKKKAAKNPGGWRGVRTSRYTYAKKEGRGALEPWLLYDNASDPYQMRNLIDDPAQAKTKKELDAMLGQWLKQAKGA